MIDQHATSYHAANAVAVSLPLASLLSHMPEIMTTVTATLGAGWYLILYFKEWRNRKK